MASKKGRDKKNQDRKRDSEFLAALAMEGADTWQRIIVYACYLISVLSFAALALLESDGARIGALSIAVICIFIVVIFVLIRYKSFTTPAPLSPPADAQSPHRKGMVQMSAPVHDRVLTVLRNSRNKVYELLREVDPSLSDKAVRANIFFPDWADAGAHEQCTLKIYPGLHINMDLPGEREIKFTPGQGATGHVFESGRPRVTQRLEASDGDWDTMFEITPELAKIIHPDLKWIISMPLAAGKDRPVGVMNIDGLSKQFDVDTLYACMAKITDNVIVIHGLITST